MRLCFGLSGGCFYYVRIKPMRKKVFVFTLFSFLAILVALLTPSFCRAQESRYILNTSSGATCTDVCGAQGLQCRGISTGLDINVPNNQYMTRDGATRQCEQVTAPYPRCEFPMDIEGTGECYGRATYWTNCLCREYPPTGTPTTTPVEATPPEGGSSFEEITNPVLRTDLRWLSGGQFFSRILSNALSLGFVIGAIVFVFMFLWGGVQWISAGDDKVALEMAKKRLTNAGIGLIILFCLFAIAGLVEVFFGVNITSFDIGDFSL